MKKLYVLMCVILLGACASQSQGVGGFAKAESKAFAEISKQYEKGEKNAKEGEKTITSGRKLVEKGRNNIRKGETMVFEGNQAIQNARNEYAMLTGYVATPVSPSEIQADNDELKVLLKNWNKGIEKVKDGNKLISSGNKQLDQGESKIREGRAKADYGQSLMRQAESAYNSRKTNFSTY